jgi:O-antigen ligase
MTVMTLVLLLSAVVAYHKSPTFGDRINTTQESIQKLIHDRDYDSSLGGRAAMTVISLDLAADHWLFGMGTADHTGEILETIRRDYSELWFLSKELAHPHNEYLNALLQFGVVGLMAFLNIPFQLLRYKNENRNDELMFSVIGISILFYVLQDIMVIDLGMLFTVVVLVSAGLREYAVKDVVYRDFDYKQAGGYVLAMIVFYLLKQI